MIGGFILGGGSEGSKVVVRGLGPSLALQGVAGALADPTLELRDSNGVLLAENDEWQSDPNAGQVQAAVIAPSDPHESALYRVLQPAHTPRLSPAKMAEQASV